MALQCIKVPTGRRNTCLALRTDALRTVSSRPTPLDLLPQRRKRGVTRGTRKRVEDGSLFKTQHRVRSTSLGVETGPHPSRLPWWVVLRVGHVCHGHGGVDGGGDPEESIDGPGEANPGSWGTDLRLVIGPTQRGEVLASDGGAIILAPTPGGI
jgi:hypothetical protein